MLSCDRPNTIAFPEQKEQREVLELVGNFKVLSVALCKIWESKIWESIPYRLYELVQGVQKFFNSKPNSDKHNIPEAAPLNRIFYQLLILPAIKIKVQ